jgi:hypothetical protein
MLAEHKEGAPSAVTEHLAVTGGELTAAEIRERMSGSRVRIPGASALEAIDATLQALGTISQGERT